MRLAALLTLIACSGATDAAEDSALADTGTEVLYSCECDPEWQDPDGFCMEGGFSFSCSGGNVTRCEEQCAQFEDPCCAPYWLTE